VTRDSARGLSPMCQKVTARLALRTWRPSWPHMWGVRPSRCGVSTAMMVTGSPLLIAPISRSEWHGKRTTFLSSSDVWYSMYCPKAANASGMTGCKPPRRLRRSRACFRRPGPRSRPRQGGREDHPSPDLPSTVLAAHGWGPLALSPLLQP